MKKTILIVEDNPDILMITAMILEKEYTVLTAITAELGFEALETNTVDLILMDMFLGAGASGVDLTRQIRTHPKYKDLPIIAHSAHAMSVHMEEALAAGMNDYIAKPYRIKALEEIIRKWI